MSEQKAETWKSLPNYENRYAISNYGRIKNIKNRRMRVSSVNHNGYAVITLKTNGIPKTYKIHILVWEVFGDTPRKNLTIDHIDNDKTNNHIDNLQLLSMRDNIVKAKNFYKKSGLPTGVSRKNSKYQSALTVDGRSYYLGVFNCPTAAYIKREVAFRVFNGRLS